MKPEDMYANPKDERLRKFLELHKPVETQDRTGSYESVRKAYMSVNYGNRFPHHGYDTGTDKAAYDPQESGLKTEERLEKFRELNELSKKTLGKYIEKSSENATEHAEAAGWKGAMFPKRSSNAENHTSKMMKRLKGIRAATRGLQKEEVEQIDELSKKTLKSYIKKSAVSGMDASYKWGSATEQGEMEKNFSKLMKRRKGIRAATRGLQKEEVEKLNEISKDTASNYISKASRSLADNAEKVGTKLERRENYFHAVRKTGNRIRGIDRASKKLHK